MEIKEDKTKLVVLNEHTLGYIVPNLPQYIHPLSISIRKGAPFETYPSSKWISKNDKIRLASAKDFEDFRCSFEGYSEKEYEFATL